MFIKKRGKKIFGAQLSSSEKKAMNVEIRKQLAEYDRRHEIDIEAQILWVLHERFGFGPKRLRRFYDEFVPAMEAMLNHYEMGDSDQAWLCTYKLKQYGIDLEKWHDEGAKNEKPLL